METQQPAVTYSVVIRVQVGASAYDTISVSFPPFLQKLPGPAQNMEVRRQQKEKRVFGTGSIIGGSHPPTGFDLGGGHTCVQKWLTYLVVTTGEISPCDTTLLLIPWEDTMDSPGGAHRGSENSRTSAHLHSHTDGGSEGQTRCGSHQVDDFCFPHLQNGDDWNIPWEWVPSLEHGSVTSRLSNYFCPFQLEVKGPRGATFS